MLLTKRFNLRCVYAVGCPANMMCTVLWLSDRLLRQYTLSRNSLIACIDGECDYLKYGSSRQFYFQQFMQWAGLIEASPPGRVGLNSFPAILSSINMSIICSLATLGAHWTDLNHNRPHVRIECDIKMHVQNLGILCP